MKNKIKNYLLSKNKNEFSICIGIDSKTNDFIKKQILYKKFLLKFTKLEMFEIRELGTVVIFLFSFMLS